MTDLGATADQMPKSNADVSVDLVDRLGAKLDAMLDKLGEAKAIRQEHVSDRRVSNVRIIALIG